MSKKHFTAIAADLNRFWLELPAEDRTNDYFRNLVDALAYTFKQTNPNFDRTRFLAAVYAE
jgi:hypothetical protein